MALQALTERQIQLIAGNINKVLKTRDINQLSKTGYNFLYLASGFIAHYNLGGFKDHYENVADLVRDLEANHYSNMWWNFGPNDQNYHYYKSKAEVYKRLNIPSNYEAKRDRSISSF